MTLHLSACLSNRLSIVTPLIMAARVVGKTCTGNIPKNRGPCSMTTTQHPTMLKTKTARTVEAASHESSLLAWVSTRRMNTHSTEFSLS